MKAATYALARNCSVVICNGCEEHAIVNIVKGKKVGTFFTRAQARGTPTELQARLGILHMDFSLKENFYKILLVIHVLYCYSIIIYTLLLV